MSQYGICQLSLIPVRRDPAERSEMVTQILCGETFEIIETHEAWSCIRIFADAYEGWVNTRMLHFIDKEKFDFINCQPSVTLRESAILVNDHSSQVSIWLPGGSSFIYLDNCLYAGEIPLGFIPDDSLSGPGTKINIVSDSLKYLNAPYLWGGKSIFGIDCSGFTQVIFKMNGFLLPRDVWQQASIGVRINTGNDIRPGDMAFFKNVYGEISHTGIMHNAKTIIHASSKVRLEPLDAKGIIRPEDGSYSHQLSHFQRLF